MQKGDRKLYLSFQKHYTIRMLCCGVDVPPPPQQKMMSLVLLMPAQTKQPRHLLKIKGMRQRKGLQKNEDPTHVLLLF